MLNGSRESPSKKLRHRREGKQRRKGKNCSHISGCLSESASQVFKLGPPLHQPKRSQLYQLTASPQ